MGIGKRSITEKKIMTKEQVDIIKNNIGKKMIVNLPTSINCTIIGYGTVPSLVSPEKDVLKVLLLKDTPSHYKFPWKTELKNYKICVDMEMNPDNFLSVPFDCIVRDKTDFFIKCY